MAETPSAQPPADGPANGRDPKTGQFINNNTCALKHGGRSERLMERLQEEARAELAERRRAISEDLGEALSTIQADLLERYLVAVALMGWMEDRLLAEGVITAKGKRRALYSAYAAQLDRVTRLAQVLGLERRARSVDVARQLSGLEGR